MGKFVTCRPARLPYIFGRSCWQERVHKMHLTQLLTFRQESTKSLKEVLEKQIPELREEMKDLKSIHGKKKLGAITVANVMNGMRGLPLLLCDTSYVDPKKGIIYRGIPLTKVVAKLPRAKGGKEGKPEGAFWLLAAGKMPKKEEADSITKEWNKRGKLPVYVKKLMKSFDKRIHPMAQLVAVSACLSAQSNFVKAYNKGVKKTEYWEYMYEDAMNLCAYLPTVAASIYTNNYKCGEGCQELNKELDWAGNFSNMLGIKDKNFADLMRLYFVLHADHDSGNVSAHTTHLVGSALSDPYLSFAGGMTGLAGPLHGLANQEVVIWLNKLKKEIGEEPKDEDITKFIEGEMKCGSVIPGYGHAVLRVTDPRFTLQNKFAMKHCKDNKDVKLVTKLSKIIPKILKATGKVSNPNPNVDAHSGVLLQHFGVKEMQYYTVLFGVSRAIGVMPQLIWARALGSPIERPRAFSTEFLCGFLKKQNKC